MRAEAEVAGEGGARDEVDEAREAGSGPVGGKSASQKAQSRARRCGIGSTVEGSEPGSPRRLPWWAT